MKSEAKRKRDVIFSTEATSVSTERLFGVSSRLGSDRGGGAVAVASGLGPHDAVSGISDPSDALTWMRGLCISAVSSVETCALGKDLRVGSICGSDEELRCGWTAADTGRDELLVG